MNRILLIALLLLVVNIASLFAQDLIRGLPVTISLVPKSAKQPNLKLKDGAGITLVYKADDGIHVIMGKNGKQSDLVEPMSNAKLVQVGEVDIEKDGRPEVVVVNKTSSETIDVRVFKKPEFETLYQPWSAFTGVQAVEFPGDGTVLLYDFNGHAGKFRFKEDGQIAEMP